MGEKAAYADVIRARWESFTQLEILSNSPVVIGVDPIAPCVLKLAMRIGQLPDENTSTRAVRSRLKRK